ncbi:MAG: glycoside hydrolase family 38 C-terminal domain-containing protein [bacterium]
MNKKRKIGFVFSHSHWDIEWYMPYRSFRFWLVNLFDRLLKDCGHNKQFKTYVLDGQVAPVEHYLSVKPEMKEEICKLISSGKLSIGPFYTQFDEWLISPESIIRNCLYGNRKGGKFGKVMKAGYLPDNFGHPKQMPQILKGFGINNFIFWRGMPDKPADFGNEFYWTGLDGTKVFCVFLSNGYGNASRLGAEEDIPRRTLRSAPYGEIFFGYECHLENTANCDVEKGAKKLIEAATEIADEYPSGIIPLANGSDHAPPQIQIGEIIAYANELQQEILFIHGNCQDMVEAAQEREEKFPIFKGDLCGACYADILTGTLSTRSYIKQANFTSENLLEKYAEPLASFSSIYGKEYSARLLDEAWQFMLLNHAHDGIHGASVDSVYTENLQRYAAVKQIAVGICHDSLKHLGTLLPCNQKDLSMILVYNPVDTGKFTSSIEILLKPTDGDIHIEDEDGNSLPMQVINDSFKGAEERQILFAASLNPFSLKPFRIVRGKKSFPSRFKNNDTIIENKFLKVIHNKDTLNIYDKTTGASYHGLNIIEDEADAGDGWDFSEPWEKNKHYMSNKFSFKSCLIENGPVRSTLLLEGNMRIPHHLDGEKRSRRTVVLPIKMHVSLSRQARHVEVTLEIDNQAKDHRLRLKCPSGIISNTIKSQGHFGIIERPLRNSYQGKDWFQPPPQTFHFRDWAAVDDGKKGLAIACRGLYEYESKLEKEGVSLYITLLRGIGWMSKENIKQRPQAASSAHPIPGAQCLGMQKFEYAFVPYFCEKNSKAPFLSSVNNFLYPAISHLLREKPAPKPCKIMQSLFHLKPENLVLSCFKKTEDDNSYILRFFENEGKETEAILKISEKFEKVYQTSLNEEIINEMKLENNNLHLKIAPYKIITLKLELGELKQ